MLHRRHAGQDRRLPRPPLGSGSPACAEQRRAARRPQPVQLQVAQQRNLATAPHQLPQQAVHACPHVGGHQLVRVSAASGPARQRCRLAGTRSCDLVQSPVAAGGPLMQEELAEQVADVPLAVRQQAPALAVGARQRRCMIWAIGSLPQVWSPPTSLPYLQAQQKEEAF